MGRYRWGATRLPLAVVFIVWALTASSAARQAPMAETVFKNVQILRGMPIDQFMTAMSFFSASTGLNCTDCHTADSGGSWERYADDNDLKRRTRMMMLMVQNINRTNFGGRQVVTCTTCHRGSSTPQVMPSLNLLYGEPPPDEPGDPFTQAPGQPAPATLLDTFTAAAGGEQRVASLTTLTATGTQMGFDDAEPGPVEIYATAAGQRAVIARLPQGARTEIVSPDGGWLAAPLTDRPLPVIAITGAELEGVRVEAQAFFPATLRTALRNLRTGGPMVLDGNREVQCVQGDTAAGAVVTLCFDRDTRLLARMVRFVGSPVGRLVTRIDYEAYSDVAGVKVPSKWTVRWLGGRIAYALTDIRPNVRIDPARFAQPR